MLNAYSANRFRMKTEQQQRTQGDTMTLKELMQLCYNAGRDGNTGSASAFAEWQGFDDWWDQYGEERHDDYAKALLQGVSAYGEEVRGLHVDMAEVDLADLSQHLVEATPVEKFTLQGIRLIGKAVADLSTQLGEAVAAGELDGKTEREDSAALRAMSEATHAAGVSDILRAIREKRP